MEKEKKKEFLFIVSVMFNIVLLGFLIVGLNFLDFITVLVGGLVVGLIISLSFTA